GRAIPAAEMLEWVEATVSRILALRPARVLEIGCGTGLLLFRIAPHCEHYQGIDLSQTALDSLRDEISRSGIDNVTLALKTADGLSEFQSQPFDLVILNSVIQYFPNVHYLIQVLDRAIKLVKPGGSLFLGDVRSLPLLRAFHASVQLEHAPASLSLKEL